MPHVIVAFIFVALFFQVILIAIAQAMEGTVPPWVNIVLLFAQTAAFHIVAAVVVAAASRAMIARLAGVDSPFAHERQALRGRATQLAAAALYSTILTILGLFVLGPFLNVLSFVLFPLLMGPPLVVQVIAHERNRLQDALPRARGLWRGELTRVLVYLLTGALGVMLVFVIALMLAGAITYATDAPDGVAAAVHALVGGLSLGTLLAYVTALQTAGYLDLRVRDDNGFDVEDLRAELDQ